MGWYQVWLLFAGCEVQPAVQVTQRRTGEWWRHRQRCRLRWEVVVRWEVMVVVGGRGTPFRCIRWWWQWPTPCDHDLDARSAF
jgi:hypothetical protein